MRMWFLVLALAFLPEPAHAQGGPEGAKTGRSFVDKFATLDKARWYISHGWSNGPHQNCTWLDANVHVNASAMLSLTNVPTGDRQFSCAELQTREFYGYGTYEVRVRPVAAPEPSRPSSRSRVPRTARPIPTMRSISSFWEKRREGSS